MRLCLIAFSNGNLKCRAVALELANRTDRSVTPIRPWSTDNQLVQIEAAPIMRSDGNEPSNLDSPMWNSTFIPAMMMNNTVRIDTSLLMDVLGNMDSNVFLQTTKLNQLSNAINAESLPENISGEKGSAGKTWKKVPPVPRQGSGTIHRIGSLIVMVMQGMEMNTSFEADSSRCSLVRSGFLATLGASFLYSSSVVAGLESVVGNSTREAASSYIHQPLASEESIRVPANLHCMNNTDMLLCFA